MSVREEMDLMNRIISGDESAYEEWERKQNRLKRKELLEEKAAKKKVSPVYSMSLEEQVESIKNTGKKRKAPGRKPKISKKIELNRQSGMKPRSEILKIQKRLDYITSRLRRLDAASSKINVITNRPIEASHQSSKRLLEWNAIKDKIDKERRKISSEYDEQMEEWKKATGKQQKDYLNGYNRRYKKHSARQAEQSAARKAGIEIKKPPIIKETPPPPPDPIAQPGKPVLEAAPKKGDPVIKAAPETGKAVNPIPTSTKSVPTNSPEQIANKVQTPLHDVPPTIKKESIKAAENSAKSMDGFKKLLKHKNTQYVLAGAAVLLGLFAYSKLKSKNSKRKQIRETNLSDLRVKSYGVPSENRYSVSNENTGPQNLALTMNRNALRSKSYMK